MKSKINSVIVIYLAVVVLFIIGCNDSDHSDYRIDVRSPGDNALTCYIEVYEIHYKGEYDSLAWWSIDDDFSFIIIPKEWCYYVFLKTLWADVVKE